MIIISDHWSLVKTMGSKKTFKQNMLLTLETYKLCVENMKVIIKKTHLEKVC